jgi:hypothetical protein
LRNYDSGGRLKLESKADLKAPTGESSDRAAAVIRAAMLAHAPGRLTPADVELMRESLRLVHPPEARKPRHEIFISHTVDGLLRLWQGLRQDAVPTPTP